jgi:hypothetical protein
MSTDDHSEIREFLVERGHSPEEVERIMGWLRRYDARMTRQSFFDAIEIGELDMDAVVKDALKKPEAG